METINWKTMQDNKKSQQLCEKYQQGHKSFQEQELKVRKKI